MRLSERLKAHLPTVEDLQRHPWLKPVAHRLADPALWRLKPEGLARGVAIGMFWAFATPFAQTLFAAAHCVWWRGNIPVAAAITFITNPLTIGGWLWLAHEVGQRLLGEALVEGGGWFTTFGWPIGVGLATFAFGGALLGYLLMRGGARMWLALRLARRAQRRMS